MRSVKAKYRLAITAYPSPFYSLSREACSFSDNQYIVLILWYPKVNYCYSYSKTNQIHQCIKFIYFRMTLCMFRTVFPPIIRSSRQYLQEQAFVKQTAVCLLAGTRQQADSSICLTNACCCMHSLELLMMGGKTARNMQSVIQK